MKQWCRKICSMLLAAIMLLSFGASAALADTVHLGSYQDVREKLMLYAAAGLTDDTSFSISFSGTTSESYQLMHEINAVGLETGTWKILSNSFANNVISFEVEWFPVTSKDDDTDLDELEEALDYISALIAAGDFSKTEFYFDHSSGDAAEMEEFAVRLVAILLECGIDGGLTTCEHRYREDGTLAVYVKINWGGLSGEPEVPGTPGGNPNTVVQEAYDFILSRIDSEDITENEWNFGSLDQSKGENSDALLTEFRAVMNALAEESGCFTVVNCFYWYDQFGNTSIHLEVEWSESASDAVCTHEYSWFVAPVDDEMHAAACTNCGAVMETEMHQTSCIATPNVCLLCGCTTDKLSVYHDEVECVIIDALTHAEICMDCGETLSTSDHYALCNGTPGVCYVCAYVSDTVGIRHSPSASDTSLCQRCGATIPQTPEEPEQSMDERESAYAAVYSYDYYIAKYPDIGAAFNGDRNATLDHFLTSGMAEGRQGCAAFNVDCYRANYADIAGAFGDNLVLYYQHYMKNGKAEGRVADELLNPGTPDQPVEPEQPEVTPDDREAAYAAVYDFDFYTGKYPDVAAAFGGDRAATLDHFVNCGMAEGRQGCAEFNVDSYRRNYADLQNAFGSSLKDYYMHYIGNGKAENRVANKLIETKPEQPEVDPNAPDNRESWYAPVYDFDYYVSRYPDVAAAFGGNRAQTLEHFINHGMSEGRQGNAGFVVNAYRQNYSDLQAAFGSDLKDYYLHYIRYGMAEGRNAR